MSQSSISPGNVSDIGSMPLSRNSGQKSQSSISPGNVSDPLEPTEKAQTDFVSQSSISPGNVSDGLVQTYRIKTGVSRNPVLALAMFPTLFAFLVGRCRLLGRNPVLALAMFPTLEFLKNENDYLFPVAIQY